MWADPIAGGKESGIGMKRGRSILCETHQALTLFPIDWSLGGHWRAKVRGWLHERRVTEGVEGPGELRPSVFRLRHGPKWGARGMGKNKKGTLVGKHLGFPGLSTIPGK